MSQPENVNMDEADSIEEKTRVEPYTPPKSDIPGLVTKEALFVMNQLKRYSVGVIHYGEEKKPGIPLTYLAVMVEKELKNFALSYTSQNGEFRTYNAHHYQAILTKTLQEMVEPFNSKRTGKIIHYIPLDKIDS